MSGLGGWLEWGKQQYQVASSFKGGSGLCRYVRFEWCLPRSASRALSAFLPPLCLCYANA